RRPRQQRGARRPRPCSRLCRRWDRRRPLACATRSRPAFPLPPASAGARPRPAPSISTARAATCTPASTLAQPAARLFMPRPPVKYSAPAGTPPTAVAGG
ncbi:hypothetical protein ARTHROSP310_08790, partial [Arthrobacter sp. AD-310]